MSSKRVSPSCQPPLTQLNLLKAKLLLGSTLTLSLLCLNPAPLASAPLHAGPLFDHFQLTLDPGERTEAIGPLYYSQRLDTTRTWAAPPLVSYTLDEVVEFEELDILYPLLTYDRFGTVYRFQLFQLFSFAGGAGSTETNVQRFTLFPFYFRQHSADNPERNYTAVFPIYGTLKNRLFRDEIRFVLWPGYSRTRKREVVTDNYLYPIFHRRQGPGLRGWQVWPIVGHETKELTHRTNIWEEVEIVGGHDKWFAAWPIYHHQRTELGTTNESLQHAVLPLYSYLTSPLRDSWTAPWPIGVTRTEDRQKGFVEWGLPWPIIVFSRGPGKQTDRVFPFYSQARTETLQSDFYAWPIYSERRIRSAPLDRRRTRILFFLYSDLVEANTETGQALHRVDVWPLFTHRKDFDGRRRLQVLALLEPLLPNNKSIQRNYSPLWSLWRSETNPATGASSQSLLWNLFRRETSPRAKKCSLLFGLFQYQSNTDGRRWRVFYVPLGRSEEQSP